MYFNKFVISYFLKNYSALHCLKVTNNILYTIPFCLLSCYNSISFFFLVDIKFTPSLGPMNWNKVTHIFFCIGDIKQEPGMYREGPTYQRRGSLQLWQFLVALLDDPSNSHFIAWTGRGMEFKLIEPEEVSICCIISLYFKTLLQYFFLLSFCIFFIKLKSNMDLCIMSLWSP